MSQPPSEYRFVAEAIRITALEDPVVDLLGHDPRSVYVERFWLSILGPSTTFLLRHVAARLDAEPDGFDLDLDDTAAALGLGPSKREVSPFIRAVARTGQFHLSQPCGPGALAVRRHIPPLTRQQVARLKPHLRDAHDAWQQAEHHSPTIEQRQTRARRLALSLLELGETDEATEQQLHRWKVHPAMAHEALRWAHVRRGSALPAVGAAASDRTPVPAPVGAPASRSLRPRPPTVVRPAARFDPFTATSDPAGDAA